MPVDVLVEKPLAVYPNQRGCTSASLPVMNAPTVPERRAGPPLLEGCVSLRCDVARGAQDLLGRWSA